MALATTNSGDGTTHYVVSGRVTWLLLGAFILAWSMAWAEVSVRETAARSAWFGSEKALRANPVSLTAGWEFARACFDAAEFATNNTERAALAEHGIAAATEVINRDATNTAAFYYLAMCYGQLARTKGIGALKVVENIESNLVAASNLDPKFDYGGPHRGLGLLYRDAPTWVSVGNRKKARHHLETAVSIAPAYPENRLNFIEALLQWNDRNGALREYKALKDRWQTDLKGFSGSAWIFAVADWKARYSRVTHLIEDPPKPLLSPRGEQK